MDFELSAEQRLLRDTIRSFVDAEIRPVARELEESGQYPDEIVATMRELGLFGLLVPEEYGGLAADMVSLAVVFEEISRGWMGIAGIIGSHSLSCWMIATHGTDEQKRAHLPALASGERRTGIALTEPGAGSDLQGIATTARRDGETLRLNGRKTWITNARHADPLPVLVKTDPAARPAHAGMSVVLVDAGTPGFEVVRDLPKLGYRGPETCELVFDNAVVPASNVLGGQQGRGLQQVLSALEKGRINIAARAVGVAQEAYDQALRYAGEREAFGQKIAQLPGGPAQAGRHGDEAAGGTPADLLGGLPGRCRPARRPGVRPGQGLRLRGRLRMRVHRDAGARRLRLLQGIHRRTAVPGRSADGDRRRHQ